MMVDKESISSRDITTKEMAATITKHAACQIKKQTDKRIKIKKNIRSLIDSVFG